MFRLRGDRWRPLTRRVPEAAGLTVLVVWDREVWHDPAGVTVRVMAARRRVRAAARAAG